MKKFLSKHKYRLAYYSNLVFFILFAVYYRQTASVLSQVLLGTSFALSNLIGRFEERAFAASLIRNSFKGIK